MCVCCMTYARTHPIRRKSVSPHEMEFDSVHTYTIHLRDVETPVEDSLFQRYWHHHIDALLCACISGFGSWRSTRVRA